MRNRRRQLWIAIAVLILLAGAITAALLFRKHRAPDVVRLLPDSDAVFYVNLEPIRLLTDLGKKPPANRDPDYEQFVKATGFEFERDLHRAAFAIHYGNSASNRSPETRYSGILQGNFNASHVSQYLRNLPGSQVERYRDFDVYVVPLEDRTLRVALLGIDTAATSNIADPGFIHYMIDRYKESALPFPGPNLVRDYYAHVPFGSVVWTIARTPAQSTAQDRTELLLPGAWSSLLPKDSVVIASARPLNDIHLRAQVLTQSEDQARRFSERLQAFLALFKAIDISMDGGGPDPDVKKAFDSFSVKQDKSEAVITAAVPFAFFKKIVSEAPVDLGAETQKPPEQNAPAADTNPKK